MHIYSDVQTHNCYVSILYTLWLKQILILLFDILLVFKQIFRLLAK